MDNPVSESITSTEQATVAFANLFGGEPAKPAEPAAAAPEAPASEEDAAAQVLAQEQQQEQTTEPASDEPRYKVKLDGQEIEVPLSELTQGYQRQADYTKKTMEVAETRKAAEAEAQAAKAEREQYAQTLQTLVARAESALGEQNSINWQQLLETDPVEYLKQRHLFDQRQAALEQVRAEQGRIEQQQKAEQAKTREEYMRTQHQALLDKLPEWKDEGKAKAEKAALVENLVSRGFTPEEIATLSDHRMVLIVRDAMKYQQVMDKAKAAAQKVASVPPKVERPGVTASGTPDGRTSVIQQLKKSGGSDQAAMAAFAKFL